MIDIVIPARNEASTIGPIVEAFRHNPRCGVVYVVNDGSTDSTASVAASAGARIISGPALGKGQAMTAGLKNVSTERVVFCDGDLAGFTSWHAGVLLADYAGEIIGRPDSALSWRLSGERALPVYVIHELPLYGWLAEVQINDAVRKAGLPVRRVQLPGVNGATRAGISRLMNVGADRMAFSAGKQIMQNDSIYPWWQQ